MASTYGIAPPLTIGHDGALELPCSDALWQARNETEWNEARIAEISHGRGAATTIRDAFALLVDTNDEDSPSITGITALRWSPFAVVSILHILSTRLWHATHGTLSGVAAARLSPAAASPDNNPRGGASKLFTAGRRCHELIRAHYEHVNQGNAGQHARDARWQLANAADVLRVCYCRTVPALAHLDCDSLLRGSPDDVLVAVQEYVVAPLERTPEFTLAAAMAYEGLCVPLRCGAQFFRKAGALTGSLEHLIAGWDNGEFWTYEMVLLEAGADSQPQALLVSKWVHVVSGAQALDTVLDTEERELLQNISAMLWQEETDLGEGSCLAARLLRYWAAFYDDVWVWGGKSGHLFLTIVTQHIHIHIHIPCLPMMIPC